MTLLSILYWLVLFLTVICYFVLHAPYVILVGALALFIIIGLRTFRTSLE